MNHPELPTVAQRVVWFKAPDDALKDVKLFLAHVMTHGTLSDIPQLCDIFLRKISRPC